MDFINLNGKIFHRDQALLPADDHSYRYGHGLFETMKFNNGKIILADLHFERLLHGLHVLQITLPKHLTTEKLEKEITALCIKNQLDNGARVRLSISPGNGGLYDSDDQFTYLIECWSLPADNDKLNENGLVIDIFPDARKSCDIFSNLKSSSHLPYVMAAQFAKKNKLNDCLLLNAHERICDATIANVFWVNDGTIFTPPLSEGCIAGVMRKHLLNILPAQEYELKEKECRQPDLEAADEIFLTNAIRGIRWVGSMGHKTYSNKITSAIFAHLYKETIHSI